MAEVKKTAAEKTAAKPAAVQAADTKKEEVKEVKEVKEAPKAETKKKPGRKPAVKKAAEKKTTVKKAAAKETTVKAAGRKPAVKATVEIQFAGNTHTGIDCDGGFAEYVQVPKESLIPLPDNISLKLGAFVEPVAVAVHALREQGYVPGDNAIVFGCGPIGMLTALTLRVFGCQDLLMMEIDPVRAQMARDMGFEVQDSSKVGDMGEYCKSRTGGDGYDWVFDCVGIQSVADVLLDAVKVKGHVFIVASYAKPAAMPYFMGMAKEASIVFTRVYRQKDFALATKIVGADPDFEKIITHVLPADQAEEGIRLLTTKGTGAMKVLLKFDGVE